MVENIIEEEPKLGGGCPKNAKAADATPAGTSWKADCIRERRLFGRSGGGKKETTR